MLTFVLSYLLAVSEMRSKFTGETIAKIQLHHCQAFGVCLYPPCRPVFTAQHHVLLMAPDSHYHRKALKKKSAFLCPSSKSFSCLLIFPGG